MRGVAREGRIPPDFALRIKRLRGRLGLTQVRLAELLGVSFASVNRWENGQSRPSLLAWQQIVRAERLGVEALGSKAGAEAGVLTGAGVGGGAWAVRETSGPHGPPPQAATGHVLDFAADPEAVRAVSEAERLAQGHLFNPAFGAETSLIDLLPHQYTAVYEHMLPQPRLRFLLADDAGAGKTIMAGLYVREMLARRLIRRVLIVPPAGLVGNWEHELRRLFSLPVHVVTGADARRGNPFCGPDSDLVLVSLDTLASETVFARLQEPVTEPYDLAIFDEAHKLAADRGPDFRVRKTHRYRLAEALAGIHGSDPQWRLDWSPRHLLLLTATPHMGRDFPYYCLWRLLEPEALPTFDAFSACPRELRARHFIRRNKEEMVRFDGTPIYPARVMDTLSFELTRGEAGEQALYDETTDYIRSFYDLARLLARPAVRLAMSIFQRRLASSTYALMRSFERRLAKLEALIDDVSSGRLTPERLAASQAHLAHVRDVLWDETADEEGCETGEEDNVLAEDEILGAVTAGCIAELEAERREVVRLLGLARRVYEAGCESKFAKMREVILDPRFKNQKMIVFSEYRDTVEFLARRLEGLGFAGKVARIDGSMTYRERDEQIGFFRRPIEDGGAAFLVATDAAGEGVNLQVAWLMINYDIPWNPARLEQRMGRIHRYGQEHDPVVIINLVAGGTREGRVLKTLLEKLERIRKELGSDKVFDVIGRLFEGVSLKDYMEQAVTDEGAAAVCAKLEGRLTVEQVRALRERERRIFGEGGDVRADLTRIATETRQGELRRVLPGYVRRFVEGAAPLVNLAIDGDLDGTFRFRALGPGALDWLWSAMDSYGPDGGERTRFAIRRPQGAEDGVGAVFLRPGEPVFDRFCELVRARLGGEALRGAVFVDPYATRPYLFHLARVTIERRHDAAYREFARTEMIEHRLVGVREEEDGRISACPVESLLLLRSRSGIPPQAVRLAASARDRLDDATRLVMEELVEPLVDARRRALRASLAERMDFVRRGYDYESAELAQARSRYREKAARGEPGAEAELARTRERQLALEERRERALAALRREPELLAPGQISFVAHALVVPSTDPEDRRRHDDAIEAEAVRIARAHEENRGAVVTDVSTPERGVAAGLGEHPGFDLLSRGPGADERAIEVKGRAGTGDIELTENEWAKACNLRDRYWLYVVFGCATARPRLLCVRDPFGKLLVRRVGAVLVDEDEVLAAAEPDEQGGDPGAA